MSSQRTAAGQVPSAACQTEDLPLVLSVVLPHRQKEQSQACNVVSLHCSRPDGLSIKIE